MNEVLSAWNGFSAERAQQAILPCCGSRGWARLLVSRRPVSEVAVLLTASDEVWWSLSEADWDEAFRHHPRIGESAAPPDATAQSAAWSRDEQRRVAVANDDARLALAARNRDYEKRFHRIFIVCADGKSPQEILAVLDRRLRNDDATELREAAEQQRQITQLRLKKWLAS